MYQINSEVFKINSYRQYVKVLNIMSIRQKLYYEAIIFIYNIKFNVVPMYITNKTRYKCDRRHYQLRNNKNFDIKFRTTTRKCNTMLYKGV